MITESHAFLSRTAPDRLQDTQRYIGIEVLNASNSKRRTTSHSGPHPDAPESNESFVTTASTHKRFRLLCRHANVLCCPSPRAEMPLTDAMSYLPQAKWIVSNARISRESVAGLRVHDAETALEAAVAGLGKTLLPTLVADRDARLLRLRMDAARPYPSREVWLLVHADQIDVRGVSAAVEWIETVVSSTGRRSSPQVR